MNKNKKSSRKNLIKFFLLLIILYIIVYIFRDSLPDIIAQLKQTKPLTIVLMLLVSTGYNILEGINISSLAKTFNGKVSIIDGILCSFYSAFYRVITFGGGSYLALIHYLKNSGLTVAHSISISMTQYMIHKFTIVLYLILLWLTRFKFIQTKFGKYDFFMAISIIIAIGIILFLALISFSTKFYKLVFKIIDKIKNTNKFSFDFDKMKNWLTNLNTGAKELLKDKKILLQTFIVTFFKLGCWYIIPFVIYYPDLSILDVFTMMSIVLSISGVIPSPGVGPIEFAFILIFSNLIGTNNATSGMLLYRFSTYFYPFIIGGIIAFVRAFIVERRKNSL